MKHKCIVITMWKKSHTVQKWKSSRKTFNLKINKSIINTVGYFTNVIYILNNIIILSHYSNENLGLSESQIKISA